VLAKIAPRRDIATVGPALDGHKSQQGPVLMVCSSGGHLAQLVALRNWWQTYDTVWVTFDSVDARSLLDDHVFVPAYAPTTRNVGNLLRNAWLSVRVLRQWRPSVVMSTGAGVALPFFVAAWIMRIPSVYLEVVDRMDGPTLTGRLVRPFATRMVVQWPEQQQFYPGSVLTGPVL